MFKLVIKRPNNSIYWTEYFNTMIDLDAWLSAEKKRPYYDKNWTTEIVDLRENFSDEEKAKIIKLNKKISNQNFGSLIIAKIAIINEAKGWTLLQYNALFSDPIISAIERSLWNGSLKIARNMIAGLDNTFYTDAEKIEIVSEIDKHLGGE